MDVIGNGFREGYGNTQTFAVFTEITNDEPLYNEAMSLLPLDGKKGYPTMKKWLHKVSHRFYTDITPEQIDNAFVIALIDRLMEFSDLS